MAGVTVTITLGADLMLTDDGGDYQDQQCNSAGQGNGLLQARYRHYRNKYRRRGLGDRADVDIVTVRNLAGGGTVSPASRKKYPI